MAALERKSKQEDNETKVHRDENKHPKEEDNECRSLEKDPKYTKLYNITQSVVEYSILLWNGYLMGMCLCDYISS